MTLPAPLEQLVERVGGPRRAALVAVGAVTVLLILGLSRWATRPAYVPVFTGLSLESVGELTKKLDESGIEYRLEGGGTELNVSTEDLARARVALAAGGGLPSEGRPGLELFDQPSWGMTDFTQRINYRRALEGELERTVGKMRGIESAQVHLAIQETSGFRAAERPAEASVVLKLRGGEDPSQAVVQGISHLVASSVDGLESDKVTVVDDSGRLLSTPDDAGSAAGLTSRQLAVQREVEGYLERRAEEIVAQIVGRGNTRVRVAAAVNFDRVERTVESVDPDRQVAASEQRAEIVPGAQGGAASTTTATTYENSRSLETFSGAIGNVRRLTVAVLVNDRPAEAAGGKPLPRTAEELGRIETLVRSAVGVDGARGDAVSVVSVPFAAPAAAAPEPRDVMEMVRTFTGPAITVLGLLLA
ncbi:MAG TPA: flagellar basal-body MS-ring/collar protein FliF, partial [Longimicrobiaceae bacterium]